MNDKVMVNSCVCRTPELLKLLRSEHADAKQIPEIEKFGEIGNDLLKLLETRFNIKAHLNYGPLKQAAYSNSPQLDLMEEKGWKFITISQKSMSFRFDPEAYEKENVTLVVLNALEFPFKQRHFLPEFKKDIEDVFAKHNQKVLIEINHRARIITPQ